MKKAVFEADYVEIFFNEEYKSINVIWKKANFTTEQYKDVFNRVVEFGNNNDNVM